MTWPWKNEIVDECNPQFGPLMVRYYLTPKVFGLRLVLHKFLRSDHDRSFHDHPWNFISLILNHGYWENQPDGRFVRRAGSILFRSKYHKHWVELHKWDWEDKPRPVWTLVLFWGKRRDWGFWTEHGWVKHDSYDCRG